MPPESGAQWCEKYGARWWKFDFHTHTPASTDYGRGPDQSKLAKRLPRDWLLDFMRKGIDCVAITDHNSGDWIDALTAAYTDLEKERPENFHPIHLFPGVELTVHGGIHVLALLGPGKTTSDIGKLCGAVGLPNGAKEQLELCTSKTLKMVASEIRKADGLAIPAHVDRPNGLFTKFHGSTLRDALACDAIVAMEVVDTSAPKPQLYNDLKLSWTEVLGSDSHHPSGAGDQRYPGSHFTWVKMGTPSIEGLRLALLDGTLSVQRSDQTDSGDPNQHASLVIEELRIVNARYAGRNTALIVRFSPWLTTLIGGRGTGKSTVAEALRLGLRREQELPTELRKDFDRFKTASTSRSDSGALTPETEITVTLRKDGIRYRALWRYDGSGASIEEEDGDGWTDSPGDVRSRFPVRLFSQKQVYALADDPGALLRLIDEAPQVDKADWQSRWDKQEARFLSLRSQARELGARLSDRKRVEGQLADVRRQLAIFEEGGHRDVLVRYQRAGRQRRTLDDRDDELERTAEQINELVREIEPSDIRSEPFDGGTNEETEAMVLLREAAEKQSDLAKRLTRIAVDIAAFREDWKGRLGDSSWASSEAAVGDAYRALVERLAAEGVEDPTAYGALVQRRQSLERQLEEMISTFERKAELEAEAERTLEELEALRGQLSDRRSKFLQGVLDGSQFVQMSVEPFGDDARAAEPEFRKHLAREDGRLEADILSDDGSKGLLAELYEAFSAPGNRKQCIRELKGKLVAAAGGSDLPDRGKPFINHLRGLSAERIDRLRLWWPEDGLRVKYQRAGSGFVPIEQGSAGQKSAAILAFILSYGDEPIILDQPEDDLDNHLIYDLIVNQIRQNKRKRQVIVVTHNPNIVVNGDAEKVITMVYRGGQCIVLPEGTGCLQEPDVRAEICRVMEGGEEALKKRYRRLVEQPTGV